MSACLHVTAETANLVRTLLTALGLVIGNASVILVVTISMTSRDYVLEQIRGIGSNLIIAYYEAGNRTGTAVEADFVKIAEGFGVKGRRVHLRKDLKPAIQEMLDHDGPYVLDIIVPYTEHVLPMIPAGKTVKDMLLK